MMNRLSLLTLVLFVLSIAEINAQDTDYSWPLPEKWVKEIIPFPLKFAHDLDYPGVEEIHFLPGWRGDTLPEQQWSYIFVWKLDTILNPDTLQLKNDLVSYFNGLTSWVLKNTKSHLPYQPVSWIRIEKTGSKEENKFTGNITFQDVFFTFKPVTLNLKIIAKSLPGREKTVVFFLLSPKQFNHEIWEILQHHMSEFHLEKS